MKYSFAPLIDDECDILILGSLPGEESLKKQQYYAHPRNSFWPIMFDILGKEPTDDYRERCSMLMQNHIALWDVVGRGERKGSLDSNIKNIRTNDLDQLIKSYPNIKKVLLNGKKAYGIFSKSVKNENLQVICLPSTSPAHASVSYDEKLALWKAAIGDRG